MNESGELAATRDLAGRYRLEGCIGAGGVSRVYRARDARNAGRLVAIKIIPASAFLDPDDRRRFDADAAVRCRLDHPAIVRALDHGHLPDGGVFLVMAFVDGEDLRQRLARERLLPVRFALDVLADVSSGAHAAHRAGIVHGDLKPENVMLPRGAGPASIVDFIGVRRRDSATGWVIGTPAYMAPEQLRGETPTVRSDVFSLGVMACEMLTGTLPFGRGGAGEVALLQARGVPRLADARIGAGLAAAVATAMALDPDRRPPTAAAFADLLASARPA